VPDRGVTPRDVVGIGHVVLGASALGGALFGAVMGVDHGALGALIVSGLLAAIGVVTAVAGLWLKDGQRRGGLLAGGLDLARLLLLVLAWPRTSLLDVVLTVGLLGGVLWVYPTLGATDAGRLARPPRGERIVEPDNGGPTLVSSSGAGVGRRCRFTRALGGRIPNSGGR
jgi:hypothetical protein